MAFRFQKRIKIAPGVRLNLSKSGISVSLGPRGMSLNIGKQGVRTTLGVPGTGISYSSKLGSKKSPKPKSGEPENKLALNAFERLTKSDEEKALIDGLVALNENKHDEAFEKFQHAATTIADAAFLAGVMALQQDQFDNAEIYLLKAIELQIELGKYFAEYKIDAHMELDISEAVTAHIEPSEHGVTLALAEVYQAQGKLTQAISLIEKLLTASPDDVVVRVSLAELLLENNPQPEIYQRAIQLAEGIDNDTHVHAALLYYKACALRQLNMGEAARQTLTDLLRKKKDRPQELMLAIRYERAITYAALNKPNDARKDFEMVYAEKTDYADVAERLGIT